MRSSGKELSFLSEKQKQEMIREHCCTSSWTWSLRGQPLCLFCHFSTYAKASLFLCFALLTLVLLGFLTLSRRRVLTNSLPTLKSTCLQPDGLQANSESIQEDKRTSSSDTKKPTTSQLDFLSPIKFIVPNLRKQLIRIQYSFLCRVSMSVTVYVLTVGQERMRGEDRGDKA